MTTQASSRNGNWLLAHNPSLDREDLNLYDKRPDDSAVIEAFRGEAFFERFGLLTKEPKFQAAVESLNTLAQTGPIAKHLGCKPDVSVVVPVYGQLPYTLNCLDALFSHKSKYAFEIIVVDDCSPDKTESYLTEMAGICYIRQVQNGGFINSCNTGAKHASGEYIVMLNNDTRVVAGWLDALIDHLKTNPLTGLAGSKLFYPDGSLQEAGGIVWRDGSAWNYGRNDDPNLPQYCFAREVDYVSGASIAVPMDIWRELGGFDIHYTPAYCEDSDLALQIADRGLEVWLQPQSRVIHYEGKTSGTDLGAGAKAYQVQNAKKLYHRWAERLSNHRPNGEFPHLERERKILRRVLVLDATTPTPDQDAGSVTAIKVMQVFQKLGFKVVYAPVHNYLYQPVYTDALMKMGVECLYAPYNVDLSTHLKEYGALYDVVHVFRHEVLNEVVDTIRTYCPNAKLMFNNMDLHYLRAQRQAEAEGNDALLETIDHLRDEELKTMARSDLVFVPSIVEKNILDASNIGVPIDVMPYMIDIDAPTAPYSNAGDIVFLGGFGHRPNVDAVLWFTKEIFPLICSQHPKAHFVIVGAKPPPEVLELQSKAIDVLGRVEDLRPVFSNASVFVAPLRYGAGVKGKIYTALSFGIPVVSTPVGEEGIGLLPGHNVLIAETADAFADAVLKILKDKSLAERLHAAGPSFVEAKATLSAGIEVLRRHLEHHRPT